jgi:hypothetical protein
LVVIALVGYALTGVEKLPVDKVPSAPVTALALALVLFILAVVSLAMTASKQKRERAETKGALPVGLATNSSLIISLQVLALSTADSTGIIRCLWQLADGKPLIHHVRNIRFVNSLYTSTCTSVHLLDFCCSHVLLLLLLQ